MSEIYAHDWEILEGERIPRWPSKIGEKRELRVEITSWVGISIGAKHVKVSVEEKKNQWWSESRNAWVELSCDYENNGYSMEGNVLTEEEAVKLAKFFVKFIAGPSRSNHSISWNGPGKPIWAR